MSDQFVGEIRMFGCHFAPAGWAQCNGQLLPISQNTALFSLLGTTYGGNGTTTFALPDLQGRVPLQHGQGQGLTERHLGEAGGAASVTLLAGNLPPHAHQLQQAGSAATSATPGTDKGFARTVSAQMYTSGSPGAVANPAGLIGGGGGQPHNNMQPYLTVQFCIALQGIFPPRP